MLVLMVYPFWVEVQICLYIVFHRGIRTPAYFYKFTHTTLDYQYVYYELSLLAGEQLQYSTKTLQGQ